MLRNKNKSSDGFTLVELSMVLAVVGLIVGGVLVGSGMIKNSQILSIGQDIKAIQSATATFQVKYNCLPGDCSYASTFISGATNGNGNGLVEDQAVMPFEMVQFYRHLVETKILDGRNIDGDTGAYQLRYNSCSIYPALNEAVWGNVASTFTNLIVAKRILISPYQIACLSAEDAYLLDSKYDDGNPSVGKYTAKTRGGAATYCTAANPYAGASSIASYQITSKDKICQIWVRLDN